MDAATSIKYYLSTHEKEIEFSYARVATTFDIASAMSHASSLVSKENYFDAGYQYGTILNKMLATSYPTVLNFEADWWPSKADGTTLPLAIFHGLGDQCSNPGMSDFTSHMGAKLGSYVACVEIGSGATTSFLDGFEN